MKLDQAAERLAELAVKNAEKAVDSADYEFVKVAEVLEKCANAVSALKFGPQGGDMDYTTDYNYRTWQGYHPPGFKLDEQ